MALLGISSQALTVFGQRGNLPQQKLQASVSKELLSQGERGNRVQNGLLSTQATQTALALQTLPAIPLNATQRIQNNSQLTAIQAYQSVSSFQQTDNLSSLLGIDVKI